MKGLVSILAATALVCAGCGGGGAPAAKDLCEVVGKADFPWPGEPTAKREEDSLGLTCSWSASGYSVDLKRMPDIPLETLRKSWNLKEPAKSLGGREVFVHKSGFDLQSEERRAIECRAVMQEGSGVVTLQVRNDDAADLCGDVTKLAEKVASSLK
ncbi:hypothetical protein [Allokutzneria albata]|uniref:hypothetical protein n=1 Tax=Allokutzneria albata TaxID=211114 RepID=UPI0004C3320A|nr:hypothetical protein [Allokutzneria albata]